MKKTLLFLMVLLLSISAVFAQNKTVTGKVTSVSDGLPLPGVSVSVKGSPNVGTQTDLQGNFRLAVPANATTLVFKYIGFKSTEAAITGDQVNVKLTEDQNQLSEVVVVGYGTQNKREISGSIATVSSKDFAQVPIASFDQALQGRAPGILVQANSGQPGAAANVTIRGRGSVLGSNTPLYIVDGIEITANDFATLNAADYESISVLKDAASTAQYGSRGANGVIVLTSKKGKSGAAKLSYDVQYGTSTQPRSKLILMNTGQKLAYELANGNPYGWTAADQANLSLVNTDWEDVFFRTGKTANHTLNVSGGNDNTTYFISGSIFDQSGTVETTDLSRYTGRVNIDSKSGAFNFGINSTFGYSEFTNTSEANTSIAAPLNAARWLNPYETVYNSTGGYTVMTSGQPHALQELLENINDRKQFKGVGNIYLNYNVPFLKGVSLRTSLGGDYRTDEFKFFTDPTTATGLAQTGAKGSLNRTMDRYFRYTSTNSLNYATTIAKKHTLSVSLFNEIVKRKDANFAFTGYGLGGAFENEAGITPGNATNGFIPAVGGSNTINALVSYFADVKYSFNGRYFLNATVRRDGSSRFGANKQFANFSSIGASWIISDEGFMAGLKDSFLDELKLKASYGSAGNQAGIGNFQARELYGRSVYAGVSGLVQTQLANPELQWERKTTFNVGAEFSAFKNRLTGTVEYYNALTSDLFLNRQLSRTTGYSSLASNIGELENRGYEVSLNADVLKAKDFTWSVNGSFTYNRNRVKKLVGNQKEIISGSFINRVGETMNSFYLVRAAGVNPVNGNQQYLKLDGSLTETFSAADRVILGTAEVPYFGGFGTTISFKGFEISSFFSFTRGNMLFNNDRVNVENPAYLWDNLARNLVREWRKPGDITDIPRPGNAFQSGTTRFLESGNFVRFRNAMVSYNVPKQVTQRLKLSSLRMFVQGQNLHTWSNFQGYDPELSTGVNTGAQYPALRTITFGLNVGL